MVQQPLLPGASDAAYQQIKVEPVIGAATVNRVTITVCWIAPNEPAGSAPHHHTVVAYVN